MLPNQGQSGGVASPRRMAPLMQGSAAAAGLLAGKRVDVGVVDVEGMGVGVGSGDLPARRAAEPRAEEDRVGQARTPLVDAG